MGIKEKLTPPSLGKISSPTLPNMPKISLMPLLLKGGTLLVALFFIYLVFRFFMVNIEYSEQAIAQGKRVIISIPTGEIQSRQVDSGTKEILSGETGDFRPLVGAVPKIAIIISGLGLNKEMVSMALSLPTEVTLSYSPYATELYLWVGDSEHDVFLDLPMESADYPSTDGGSLALFSTFDKDKNKARLEAVLGSLKKYDGLLTPHGEKVTSSISVMQIVLDALRERDLILVYYPREGNNLLKEDADSKHVKLLEGTFVFPQDLSLSQLQARFADVENEAKDRGYAVAVIPAYPLFMDGVKEWIGQLGERGFDVVPVTDMFSKNDSPDTP